MRMAFLILALALALAGAAFARPRQAAPAAVPAPALADRVEQIRLDRINDKSELDLLKETYEWNMDVLTAVLGVIGGIFALLTWLAYREVRAAKERFRGGALALEEARSGLEAAHRLLEEKRKDYEDKADALTGRMDGQDAKLKAVELVERLDWALKAGEKALAGELAAALQALDPGNGFAAQAFARLTPPKAVVTGKPRKIPAAPKNAPAAKKPAARKPAAKKPAAPGKTITNQKGRL